MGAGQAASYFMVHVPGAEGLFMGLQLRPLILRKFKSEGDVELAQQLVLDSRGIQRARDLAAEHAALAAQAVSHPSSSCLFWGNQVDPRVESEP